LLRGQNGGMGVIQLGVGFDDTLACGTGHFQGLKAWSLVHIGTEIFPEAQLLITLTTQGHSQGDIELVMGIAKAVQLDFEHRSVHGAAFGEKDGAGAKVSLNVVPGRVIKLAGLVEGVDFPSTAVEAPGGREGLENFDYPGYPHDQKRQTY